MKFPKFSRSPILTNISGGYFYRLRVVVQKNRSLKRFVINIYHNKFAEGTKPFIYSHIRSQIKCSKVHQRSQKGCVSKCNHPCVQFSKVIQIGNCHQCFPKTYKKSYFSFFGAQLKIKLVKEIDPSPPLVNGVLPPFKIFLTTFPLSCYSSRYIFCRLLNGILQKNVF